MNEEFEENKEFNMADMLKLGFNAISNGIDLDLFESTTNKLADFSKQVSNFLLEGNMTNKDLTILSSLAEQSINILNDIKKGK